MDKSQEPQWLVDTGDMLCPEKNWPKATFSMANSPRLVVTTLLFLLSLSVMVNPYPSPRVRKVETSETTLQDCTYSNSSATPPHLLSCTWAPDNSKECQDALQALICSRRENDRIPRIMNFGDSTMHRLVKKGELWVTYQKRPKEVIKSNGGFRCGLRRDGDRCQMSQILDLPYRSNHTWYGPGVITPGALEGPVLQGLEMPYCQDCRTCYPLLLVCEDVPEQNKPNVTALSQADYLSMIYGGYIGLEFARDVEVQTDLFPTSQENVAHYLESQWNDPSLLETWEKPTCVINTGHHDVLIEGITKEKYVENVHWYLRLMSEQCHNIIWVSTTSPLTDDFTQKIEQTKEWGLAVLDLLRHDPDLAEKSVYIDVFEASKTFEHGDNIHMANAWYEHLGQIFQPETLFTCPQEH